MTQTPGNTRKRENTWHGFEKCTPQLKANCICHTKHRQNLHLFYTRCGSAWKQPAYYSWSYHQCLCPESLKSKSKDNEKNNDIMPRDKNKVVVTKKQILSWRKEALQVELSQVEHKVDLRLWAWVWTTWHALWVRWMQNLTHFQILQLLKLASYFVW